MWRVTSAVGSSTPADSMPARGRRARSRWRGHRAASTPSATTGPCAPRRARRRRRCTGLRRSCESGEWRSPAPCASPTASIDTSTPRPSVAPRTAARTSCSTRCSGSRSEGLRHRSGARVRCRSRTRAPRRRRFAACTAHSPTGPEPEHRNDVARAHAAVLDRVKAGAHHVAGEQRHIVCSCPPARGAARGWRAGTSAMSACVPCSEPSVAPWPNVRECSQRW